MRSFKLFSIIVLLTAVLLISCKSKSAKELIVNKWKVTAVSDEKSEADGKLSDNDKKELVEKTTLEFTADGKCSITSNGNVETGTYTVSEDGKTVTMTQTGKDHGDIMEINDISDSKLVITESKSKMKLTMSKQ